VGFVTRKRRRVHRKGFRPADRNLGCAGLVLPISARRDGVGQRPSRYARAYRRRVGAGTRQHNVIFPTGSRCPVFSDQEGDQKNQSDPSLGSLLLEYPYTKNAHVIFSMTNAYIVHNQVDTLLTAIAKHRGAYGQQPGVAWRGHEAHRPASNAVLTITLRNISSPGVPPLASAQH
jgi:hypothetical protein